MLRIKRLAALMAAIFLFGTFASAQRDTIPLSAMAREMIKYSDGSHKIAMAMWMPWQYWDVANQQSAEKDNPVMLSIINTFKRYSLICVVDGQISSHSGTVFYKTEKEIRDSLRLIVNDSIVLRPIATNDLDDEVVMVLNLLRPTMINMVGQLGGNMNFYIFENVDNRGNYYLDAEKECKFSVQWNPQPVTWRLPMDILTPQKICPTDQEKLSGKFKYCPYHGVRLKSID
jgi:hypothetical protein